MSAPETPVRGKQIRTANYTADVGERQIVAQRVDGPVRLYDEPTRESSGSMPTIRRWRSPATGACCATRARPSSPTPSASRRERASAGALDEARASSEVVRVVRFRDPGGANAVADRAKRKPNNALMQRVPSAGRA